MIIFDRFKWMYYISVLKREIFSVFLMIQIIILVLMFVFVIPKKTGPTNFETNLYEINRKTDEIRKILKLQSESDSDAIAELKHYPAIRPISVKDLKYVSSVYGDRISPTSGVDKFHYGMDFVANEGAPVYATADGVILVAEKTSGYGNIVEINHKYGYVTAYAHLNSILVKKGQDVMRGDIIGTVGKTGEATGNHLHYEVVYLSKPIDPVNFYP